MIWSLTPFSIFVLYIVVILLLRSVKELSLAKSENTQLKDRLLAMPEKPSKSRSVE